MTEKLEETNINRKLKKKKKSLSISKLKNKWHDLDKWLRGHKFHPC